MEKVHIELIFLKLMKILENQVEWIYSIMIKN
jgi:hypothetical protein